jgi:cellulose synthase/poly-beta-1,6-N-acetylglucosamine synthase-like glycosyltransferase
MAGSNWETDPHAQGGPSGGSSSAAANSGAGGEGHEVHKRVSSSWNSDAWATIMEDSDTKGWSSRRTAMSDMHNEAPSLAGGANEASRVDPAGRRLRNASMKRQAMETLAESAASANARLREPSMQPVVPRGAREPSMQPVVPRGAREPSMQPVVRFREQSSEPVKTIIPRRWLGSGRNGSISSNPDEPRIRLDSFKDEVCVSDWRGQAGVESPPPILTLLSLPTFPPFAQANRPPTQINTPAGSTKSKGGGHARFFSRGRVDSFRRAVHGNKALAGKQVDDDAFYYNSKARRPDPQAFEKVMSGFYVKVGGCVNIVLSIIYLIWRWKETIPQDRYFFGLDAFPVRGWAITFYISEIILVLGIWVGHAQRAFPIKRTKITMDELVPEDATVGYNTRTAILLPTHGESLEVVMYALLGAVSQRMWNSALPKNEMLRVIVLDEKRRKKILTLCALVYGLSVMIRHEAIVNIIHSEGVHLVNVQTFYKWWKGGGYARKHLYNISILNRACMLMEYMQKVSQEVENEDIYSLGDLPKHIQDIVDQEEEQRSQSTEEFVRAMLSALNIDDELKIKPAYLHVFNSNPGLPTLVYYSRRDASTPKVSPKAGNMNAALFPVDYPKEAPIVGDATLVAVNDCRHELLPDFLQRTVPYFFKLDQTGKKYVWDKVAFVQTPQRFTEEQVNFKDDPLGNNAAVQYDIINIGKDGVGAVSSSGHGSVWRVESLRGVDASGRRYANADARENIGTTIGFRSEMLIEDTHTTIELFRHGWESRYVNQEGEYLSQCTHQPNSIQWRVKQVLRWHQGAVQLLFYKGIGFTSFGGEFPTFWHRLYAFDQATYYFNAFPGYILLIMPIIYGVTGESPFDTNIATFMLYFVPFIVTAMLPNAICGSWQGVDSEKLTRDEQIWLSTTYVQCYAFLSMFSNSLLCGKQENAWAVNVPTWPLFTAFFGQFVALGCAMFWVSYYGFENWAPNLFSICASCFLALFALWPMVSLQLGWFIPSVYYVKLLVWIFLGIIVIVVGYSDPTGSAGVVKFVNKGHTLALRYLSLTT